MHIDETKKTILEIDKQIAELFQQRMHAAEEIAAYRKERGLQVFDPAQEKGIIERNSALITDEAIKEYYINFVQDTLAITRKYQERLISGAKVAYSGVEGAFAFIAAKRIFPNDRYIAYHSFDEAYLSVVEGECDYAVLPIENSYAGEVGQVLDLMFHGALHVNGVYNLNVVHHLLGVPGAKLSDITTVISHPQALSQCDPYIQQHGFTKINEVNTAVAGARVSQTGDIHTAAIASEETAELYGLTVLDREINESKDNTTRFAVFSRTKHNVASKHKGSTFILLFRVSNEAGALAKTLTVVAKYGYNMNVLRSRPIKTTPWKYYFYAEIEGSPSDEKGKEMLQELKNHCDMIKVAGQYIATRKALEEGEEA